MATKGSDGGACSHVVEQRSTVEEKNNRTLANTVERNRFGRGTHTQSTQLPPEGCGKAKAMEDEQQMTRYASSLPLDGRSSVREHIPRGQTRRLASAFELMAEEAIAGKDLEHRFRKAKRFPRHQSLPSRNDIHIECDRYGTLRKAQLDDSFLELQYSDDENCYICHPELQQDIAHDDNGAISACKHNWKPMLETQYVEIGGTPNVHYIANRLENAKMKNSCGSFTYLTSTTPLNSINQLTESRRYASLLDGSSKNPKLGYDLATVAMDYGVSEVVRYPSETGCYGDEHLTSIGTNNVYLYAKNEKKYKELNDVQQRDGRYYELPTEKVCDQHIGGSIQDQDMNIGQAMDQEHMTDNDTSATSLFHCADPNEMSHRFICAGKALKYCCAECGSMNKVEVGHGLHNGSVANAFKIDETPIRFSPATFKSAPSAGERVVVYERKETGNLLQSKRDAVRRDPVATSTPLEGSPELEAHLVHDSPSRVLNRSGISTITSSTLGDIHFEQNYAAQIKRLNEGILVQEERLSQAVAALSHAKSFGNRNGAATLAELCAHRELLLCRERHIALNRELERIKMLHLIKKRIPQLSQRMQATFEVSSINVHLNRNFCIKNDGERDAYAFLALLKAADQVCATEAVTPIGGRTMRVNSVQFNDHILFTELPLDLTITLEIYALKMQEATRPNDRHCAVLRDKAKSLLNPHICVLKQSMTDESVVSSSEFTLCGSVLLNRDTVGTQRFYMDNVEYPLEGTVEVKSCCSAIPPIIETEFSGFLTMYEVVSGLGSWARYWAVLRRAAVHFWKYPDDEAAEKPSVAYMDLTKCVNLKVKRVELDICSHPNTFSVDLLLWTRPCVMEKKRVLLSADTKAQCLAWIDAINETLAILRG